MKISEASLPHYCELCNEVADPHHIISRGAGGCDCPWNVIYLCVLHHSECHALGSVMFPEKYNLDLIWEFAREHYYRRCSRLTDCSMEEGYEIHSGGQ